MAGEIKGGYEQPPKVESPERKRDTKQEILEASKEAADAAKTFLAETQAEFDRLFGQLELSGLSEEELAEFSTQYEKIISELEKKLTEVQKEKSLASTGLDLGDIFGEENVVDAAGDLDTQENVLARLREETTKRKTGIQSEVGRRGEKKRKEETEKAEGETFVQGIESSGLNNQLVFRALEAADPDRVNKLVQEKINNPSEELAPQIQKAVEAARIELKNKLKELENQQKKEEAALERQKGQVREKFEPSANVKTLKEILGGNDQARKEMVLNKIKNIPEGQNKEEFAKAMVEAKIDQEFKNDPAVQTELARLESEKQGLEQKYKDLAGEVEKQTSEQEVEVIKKMLGEKFVPELLRSDISKDALAQKLADEIYKEEKGKRGSALDMRAAMNLPEKVTGALLKKYTLAEVGALVGQGAYKPDSVPPIFWSKAFETRLGELQNEEKALRDSSLINMKEGSEEYNQLVTHLKEADLAYRQAETNGDRTGMEAAAKKYNDVIGDELKKMLQIQQLANARRGENLPVVLKIDEQARAKVNFNATDGRLLLSGDDFPDSEGRNSYFPKITEHTRQYGVDRRLEEIEKDRGVDDRYKYEAQLLLKHYKNVWTREGVDDRGQSEAQREAANVTKKREEYRKKQQEVEGAYGKKANEMKTFIEKAESSIESGLQHLQSLDISELPKELQKLEQQIRNFLDKEFPDGERFLYLVSQEVNTLRDAKVTGLIQETQKAYEPNFSDLKRKQNELGEEWREALKPFKRKVDEAAFAAERARAEREQEARFEAKRREQEQVRQEQDRVRQETEKRRQELEAGERALNDLGAEFSSLQQQYDGTRDMFFKQIDEAKNEKTQIENALNKNRSEATKFGILTRTVEAVVDNRGTKQRVNKEQMQELIGRQENEVKALGDKEQRLDQERKTADANYTQRTSEIKGRLDKIIEKSPELRSRIPASLGRLSF